MPFHVILYVCVHVCACVYVIAATLVNLIASKTTLYSLFYQFGQLAKLTLSCSPKYLEQLLWEWLVAYSYYGSGWLPIITVGVVGCL